MSSLAAPSNFDTSKPQGKILNHLDDAIRAGRVEDVKAAIANASPDTRQPLLKQGLRSSCKDFQAPVMHFLVSEIVEQKLDLGSFEPVDEKGRTPLMLALKAGSTATVDLLIKHGLANITAKDDEGKTALMYRQTMSTIKRIMSSNPGNIVELVNAKDKCGQTVLMWALHESPDEEIATFLIQQGARIDEKDEEGRTVLMTAVWQNRMTIIGKLTTKAEVQVRDRRHRNVLHHLAIDGERAEKKDHDRDKQVLDILLRAKPNLNARDRKGLTVLACALASGNVELARLLMQRQDCDVAVQTKAGWNVLHIACGREKTPEEIVIELIQKGKCDINGRTLRSRKTPLHIAVQSGNMPVIKHLLSLPCVRRTDRDAYGDTPLLCAAHHNSEIRAEIGKLLAPWSKMTINSLEEDRRYDFIKNAADKCMATVVDFDKPGGDEPKSKTCSIYELISKHKEHNVEEPGSDPHFSTKTDKHFRWIHLPSNNISWCRDLITKIYIERGCEDVQGFRDLERSLNHQHLGHRDHLHSRYMTPMCQAVHRTSKSPSMSKKARLARLFLAVDAKDFESDIHPGKPLSTRLDHDNDPIGSARAPVNDRLAESPKIVLTDPHSKTTQIDGIRSNDASIAHVFMFMPYLHHENFDDMIRMKRELRKFIPSNPRSKPRDSTLEKYAARVKHKPNHVATQLFEGHLHVSNLTLHIRRTLDQFFYHNIDTQRRDRTQVVYRYQRKTKVKREARKILMVDQFWMWIIDHDLVITAFPHSWESSVDELDMLEDIMETIVTGDKDSVMNVHHLALRIVSRFYGVHEGQGFSSAELRGPEMFSALEIFSAEIGDAMDREVKLFNIFARHAKQANYGTNGILADTDTFRKFNEALLNIKSETDLLKLVKDIRDELGMLRVLFESQKHIVPYLQDAIEAISKQSSDYQSLKQRIDKNFNEQKRNIERPLETVKNMEKQAERIYLSIRDLLDLKQKHVNAIEARYSREQATSTSRQGKTLLVFTIVTVIFLPLSFIAAFFAIPIGAYKRHSDADGLELSFVSKWTFGIGMPLAVVCVVAALLVGPFALTVREHWIRSGVYRAITQSKTMKKFKKSSLYKWWMQGRAEAESQKKAGDAREVTSSEEDDSEDEF